MKPGGGICTALEYKAATRGGVLGGETHRYDAQAGPGRGRDGRMFTTQGGGSSAQARMSLVGIECRHGQMPSAEARPHLFVYMRCPRAEFVRRTPVSPPRHAERRV